MEFHRGRLVDHVLLIVKNIEASRAFYGAVLTVFAIPIEREGEDWFLADELFVRQGTPQHSRGIHLALQAGSEAMVEQFFAVALDAGGGKNSAPGYDKRIHPYYYSASVTDPDGNTIEAVCHGPVARSAEAVTIEPSAFALLSRLF